MIAAKAKDVTIPQCEDLLAKDVTIPQCEDLLAKAKAVVPAEG